MFASRLLTRSSLAIVIAFALVSTTPGLALSAQASVPASADAAPGLSERNLEHDTVSAASLLGKHPVLREQKSAGVARVAAAGSSAHIIDVAVVVPSDSAGWGSSNFNDAAVAQLVSNVAAYWSAQTDGLVASVAVNPTIQHYGSTTASCDRQDLAWQEAAATFGHQSLDYYLSTASHHLLVLTPGDCTDAGLGSVGLGQTGTVSTSNGGVLWVSLNGLNNLDGVAHEFGHNLGLMHSNAHSCPSASMSEGLATGAGTFSDGCQDDEYGDFYDVMGPELTVDLGNSNLVANAKPNSLNVTQRERLQPIAGGAMQTIALSPSASVLTSTSLLESTGQTTGLRYLKVTDPRTQATYYVDYRGGAGVDAGSLYAAHNLHWWGVDVGVRVLTVRPDGSSVVLESGDPTSGTDHKLYLNAGQSLSTRSGGLTVTVTGISNGKASVQVALSVPRRISGVDRYATSAAISHEGHPATAPVVYVANGTNFPDALAAAPAAALVDAPLLLTPADVLPQVVKAEIIRLQPGTIVIAGGVNSVSAAVEAELRGLAVTVRRDAGGDRYSTARALVTKAFEQHPVTSAYIASAVDFPDAMSAAAAAGSKGIPVVLVDGRANSLDGNTSAMISNLGITSVTIAGGLSAVSSAIENALRAKGLTVARQGGSDRFQTSQLLSESAFAGGASQLFLAAAYLFPDALAGAALAGAHKGPLYIVPSTCVPAAVLGDIRSFGVTDVVIIGGTSALGDEVLQLRPC